MYCQCALCLVVLVLCRMSRELRERMAKQAKAHAEKAKVGIRKARQKAVSDVRKENVSEDATRKIEKHVSSSWSFCNKTARLYNAGLSVD